MGKLTPGIDAVAIAIAKRNRAKIFPTGAYAENRLGLSAQVPMNVVYVTDGSARKIKIGKRRWCSMKSCGSNVKALEWYYRQKEKTH